MWKTVVINMKCNLFKEPQALIKYIKKKYVKNTKNQANASTMMPATIFINNL